MSTLLFVTGILVPSVLAISLCVVMLWRWRHDKDPLPAPARNAFNRTFRSRRSAVAQNVLYDITAIDDTLVNNELKPKVR